MRREYECLKDMYLEEIKRVCKKGELTPADSQVAKEALCAIELIYKVHVWDEEEEEEKRQMMRGGEYSERRGRSSTTGRYVSRNNETISRMVDKLEDMKDDAPDFHARRTIERAIKKLSEEAI